MITSMPGSITDADALARDKALTYAAVAAFTWHSAGAAASSPPKKGDERLSKLMIAVAWVNRVRTEHEVCLPLTLAGMIDSWQLPTASWLPDGPDEAFVENGVPTLLCEDLAQDAGSNPGAEVEQQIVREAMNTVAPLPDGEQRYRDFREFIVTHGHATERDIMKMAMAAGVPPARLYEPIPRQCTATLGGVELFYPCPRCKWPMRQLASEISCAGDECRRRGARYLMTRGEPVSAGKYPVPEPVPRDGHRRLLRGLWRYTLLPGLEERALAGKLEKIPGTEVSLWPRIDLYDLDVRRGAAHWRVDVKDHTSDTRLAQHLLAREHVDTLYVVVPDARKHQVPLLRRLCRSQPTLQLHTATSFVRLVRRHGARS